MTLVNRLAKYFKYCLYEEAKISAFSNLHKETEKKTLIEKKNKRHINKIK